MADPAAHREVMPQTTTNHTFNSASVALAPNHAPHHYPPHVFVDPVAAAAFYQRHPPQTHVSQPLTSTPAPHQQPPANNPPYYIPDMAAVALQQIQLQTMLQLQAQHPHPNQIRHDTQQPVPHHTTTTTPSSLPGLQPIPSHHPHAHTSTSMIPPFGHPSTIPHNPMLPIVPDAQMASAYRIGRYTPAERKIRLERYREKRAQRNYNRRVKYDCRKQIADKRRRVQGRFVKREEEIALAATEGHNPRAHRGIHQHRNSDATDATEDDTKLQQPESSGSGSSTRHVDVNGGSTNDRGEQQSFCEQSDHILQTFR